MGRWGNRIKRDSTVSVGVCNSSSWLGNLAKVFWLDGWCYVLVSRIAKTSAKVLNGTKSWLRLREKRVAFRRSGRAERMRIPLPQSCESASRTETRSNVGSYAATFIVGVVGFVVGNLALDAIKEQIHHNAAQPSSQPAPTGTPQLALQSEPRPSAASPPAQLALNHLQSDQSQLRRRFRRPFRLALRHWQFNQSQHQMRAIIDVASPMGRTAVTARPLPT